MSRWGKIAALLLWGASAGTLIAVAVIAFQRFSEPSLPPPAPIIAEPFSVPAGPDPEVMQCLALAMYHEARSEPGLGLRAVGHVVLNRVEDRRYPDNICSVVKQGGELPPCQFSWWCDGKSDAPIYPQLFYRARVTAYLLMTDTLEDPTSGATSFHANWVDPYWADHLERTITIGGHHFYR